MPLNRFSIVGITGFALVAGVCLPTAGAAVPTGPNPGPLRHNSAVLSETAGAAIDQPAAPGKKRAENRVIVQWNKGVTAKGKAEAASSAQADTATDLGSSKFQVLRLKKGQQPEAAVAALESDPRVKSAAVDEYLSAHAAAPNDPLFGQLWGLENTGAKVAGAPAAVAGDDISALDAWSRTTGSLSTVVADIDSGYRFDHPDLKNRAWTNPADAADGLDNDGNGIVDDVHGADFVGSNIDLVPLPVDGDPTDDLTSGGGHGVHTAGTIAAEGGNGIGITGVAQQASILPLRVCSYSYLYNGVYCPSSAMIAAINYAGSHGARAANISIGGSSETTLQRDAIAQYPNTLYVISAGNDASNDDAAPKYPCVWNPADSAATIPGAVDNVVCVAATDQADKIAAFSNWGKTTVDIAAPGTEILSTYVTRRVLDENFEDAGFAFTGWTNNGFARANTAPLSSFGITNDTATQTPSTTRTTVTPAFNVAGPSSCSLVFWRKLTTSSGDQFVYRGLVDGAAVSAANGVNQTAGRYSLAISIPAGAHTVSARFEYTRGAATAATNGVWLDDVTISCWAAPGQEDATSFEYLQGTSMAAPHVTGAAALLATYEPLATATQMRTALLSSVDPIADLNPVTGTHPISSGGRLNADAALQAIDALVAPDTAITAAPSSTSNSASESIAFEVRGTNAPATFECQLDAAAFAPCTSPVQLTGLVQGAHFFSVRAKDTSSALNVDPTPASVTWSTVLDSTAPVITPTVTGILGDAGWYRSDVGVTWAVQDAESTVSSSTGCDPASVTSDTAGQAITCSATSLGGSDSKTVTIKRDATVPVVELVGGPANGASYAFGTVPSAPTCSASDTTSGLAGSCSVTGYSDAAGTHTVTAQVKDIAGNSSTAAVTYTVSQWTLKGFSQPVDMGGVFNVVKRGATVPFKFEVFDGATELTDVSAIKSFAVTQVSCQSSSSVDDIEVTTTGGTSLRYDTVAGQFVQNWQTPKAQGSCYRTTLTTQDGSSLSALFKLK